MCSNCWNCFATVLEKKKSRHLDEEKPAAAAKEQKEQNNKCCSLTAVTSHIRLLNEVINGSDYSERCGSTHVAAACEANEASLFSRTDPHLCGPSVCWGEAQACSVGTNETRQHANNYLMEFKLVVKCRGASLQHFINSSEHLTESLGPLRACLHIAVCKLFLCSIMDRVRQPTPNRNSPPSLHMQMSHVPFAF